MNPSEIVETTADPAFAIDHEGTIVAWNEPAERFFGLRSSQVLEHSCWETLSGKDVFGNHYCHADCPIIRMALEHQPINGMKLLVRAASGDTEPVGVGTLVIGEHITDVKIVHHLTPSSASTELESSQAPQEQAELSCQTLTSREHEVVALLAEGKSTRLIAERLGISSTTVRNHIRRILRKLDARDRTEAVAIVRQRYRL